MTVPHVLYQGQPGPESLVWNASIDPAPRYFLHLRKCCSSDEKLSSPPFQALSCPVNGFKILAAHPFHPLCKNQQIIPNIPGFQPSLYHRAEQLLESLPATCGNCRNCHFEKHNTGESNEQVTNRDFEVSLTKVCPSCEGSFSEMLHLWKKSRMLLLLRSDNAWKNFGLSPCSQRRWLSVHCNLVRNCSATHPLLMQVNLSGHKSGANWQEGTKGCNSKSWLSGVMSVVVVFWFLDGKNV